jgi:hypothetical protein
VSDAITGITKTPLLSKTTEDGIASLEAMSPPDRARCEGLFQHYATMSASSEGQSMLATPEKVAERLHRILDKAKPRFKNQLGVDARRVDHVVTHLPWSARVAMNTRMYHLDRADMTGSHQREDAPASDR